MNSTIRFEIVSGINKGYFNKKDSNINSVNFISTIWQEIALEEFKKSNIYVSAVIKPSKTVYNESWGCPKGGEETVVITGVANKEFVSDIDEWKRTVLSLAKELKNKLFQSTLTCEFMNSELHYLK